MKSIKFFAVAALLAISSSVHAQFTNNSSSSATTSSSSDGWSSVWVEYNPINIDFNQGIDDESISGFSLGYSKAFPITSSTPIFLEAGLGLQYSTKSDFMDSDDVTFKMFSAKVPVNLIYDFAIPNSSIKIDPFVGLTLRYNISGKLSGDDDDIDLFDEDDMGKDNTFKRFQAGWQIGAKARFNGGFTIGVAYGSDFSNIWEAKAKGSSSKAKAKVNTTTLTIGYAF